MSRRARAIGQDIFIKLEEFEAGETIFECATYLGEGEGQYGTFYRFEQENQVYCIGGRALASMVAELTEGDQIELEYAGSKPSKTKGFKPTNLFKMWILDDEPEVTHVKKSKPEPEAKPEFAEEASEHVSTKPQSKGRGRPKGSTRKPTNVRAKEKIEAEALSDDSDLDDLDDLE